MLKELKVRFPNSIDTVRCTQTSKGNFDVDIETNKENQSINDIVLESLDIVKNNKYEKFTRRVAHHEMSDYNKSNETNYNKNDIVMV